MYKMKELYEKVAADNTLQAKFNEILKDAVKDGEEATEDKLIALAKEAGYDVTLDDMQTFFKELSDKPKGELSDTELDMVAGGKLDGTAIGCSICSLGFTCILASTVSKVVTNDCGQYFQAD